jgi:glycogen phosphorylase
VIPLYYDRGKMGFSPEWIQMAKRSIMSLLPRYNSERMVGEYVEKFYAPASTRGREFVAGSFAVARELASWKKRVRGAWPRVQVRALERPERRVEFGDKVRFTVGARMEEGMGPDDIVFELLLGAASRELAATRPNAAYPFTYSGERGEGGEYKFTLDLAPELCGKLEYRIRAYPFHRALSHRFEMGLMKWI